MLLIFVDVMSRKFLSLPLNGVADFVAYSIVACIFCQLGATIRNGRMIATDFIMGGWEQNRPVLARGAKAIYYLIAFLLLIRIVSWLGKDAVSAWSDGEYSGAVGAFQMPLWPFKLVTLLGSVIAAAEIFRLLAINAADLRKHLTNGHDRQRGLIGLGLFIAVCIAFVLTMAYGDLSRIQLGFLAFAGLFALVACGMPVAFSLIAMSFVAIWAIRHNISIADNAMGLAASGTVRSFEFGVVPLFVMMGLVLDRADVGRDAFRVAVFLLSGVRGGLANATVAANAVFAAITGSSIASAAVFSRIAVPPMVEAGYNRRFAVGLVAGSSVLGMLIPPSILLIIYGLIAEASVGALFVAAIVPGVLLAVCFGLLNIVLVSFFPKFAGKPVAALGEERMTLGEIIRNLAPVIFLILLVMGGIYGGVFSPTEAGAIGALGAFVIAGARRRLNWETMKGVVLETGVITASILFLIIAASLYSRMLALSSIPNAMTQFISSLDLSLVGFCLAYMVLVILLGMILDSVSILLIVLPIALPVIGAFGGDPIWFGIVTIIAVEVGLLTPPFGLSVFVVKGSLPEGFASLGDIFAGVTPYVITMILFIILLILVPGIALVLL
ncbi:MAG: TRAP transporter large permease subunit [Rhodobiaceae bacterium]|nr:TRAP transporter large permease subunit [Rhodobiaceae bacterium]